MGHCGALFLPLITKEGFSSSFRNRKPSWHHAELSAVTNASITGLLTPSAWEGSFEGNPSFHSAHLPIKLENIPRAAVDA